MSQKQSTTSDKNHGATAPTRGRCSTQKSQINPTNEWLGRLSARAVRRDTRTLKNWENVFFFSIFGLGLLVALKKVSFVHCNHLESSKFSKRKLEKHFIRVMRLEKLRDIDTQLVYQLVILHLHSRTVATRT